MVHADDLARLVYHTKLHPDATDYTVQVYDEAVQSATTGDGRRESSAPEPCLGQLCGSL